MMPLQQEQQQQPGLMGAAQTQLRHHRLPVRSKTFTAGSTQQQHQAQLGQQLMPQMGGMGAASAPGSSRSNATSVSFNDYASQATAGSTGGGSAVGKQDELAAWRQQHAQQQQQLLLLQQQQQLLLQREVQALLQKQGGVLTPEQQQQLQTVGRPGSFTFAPQQQSGPRVGSSPVASAAAAIAAAQQKQKHELARQAAAASASSGSNVQQPQQE
jgi:hypothetical protein